MLPVSQIKGFENGLCMIEEIQEARTTKLYSIFERHENVKILCIISKENFFVIFTFFIASLNLWSLLYA